MAKVSFFDREFVLPAILLGLGIFLSAIAVSYTLYAIRAMDNTLSITGSAKTTAQADSAKWTLDVYRSADEGNLQNAYTLVARDADAVKRYFVAQGIPADAITANTVVADQDWSAGQSGGPARYRVHEQITVETTDVEKLHALSQNAGTFVSQGYSVAAQQPEYYISNLPDLRVSLLGKAIEDVRARAQAIAGSGGGHVGKLKSATSGVVQVLAPNSTSADDYGSYDTSTIDKEVSVTARATFLVN